MTRPHEVHRAVAPLLLLPLLLLLVCAGCACRSAESGAGECRAVSETIRKAQAELADMGGEPDRVKLGAQADQADAYAKAVGDIQVRDPQLAELVAQYHTMSLDMAGLLREASKGELGMDVYTRRARELQQTDDDLVARLNGYCKLDPKP